MHTYKEKFSGICQLIFDYGLLKYDERQAEVNMFWDCMAEAKTDNKQLGQTQINNFMEYKKKVRPKLYNIL